jgi:hypothetical protein
MTEGEAVVEDYVAMRLTLRSHPVALIRDRLHLDAHELIRETLRELGQEKPLDKRSRAGVGSGQ